MRLTAVELVVRVIETPHAEFIDRIQNVITIGLALLIDRALHVRAERGGITHRRRARSARSDALRFAEEAADFVRLLLRLFDSARRARIDLRHGHLRIRIARIIDVARAVEHVARLGEHQVRVVSVIGGSERFARLLIMRERDRVLSLTAVEVAERVLRSGDAFRIVRLRVKLERLFERAESLLRIAALQEAASLRQSRAPVRLRQHGVEHRRVVKSLRV